MMMSEAKRHTKDSIGRWERENDLEVSPSSEQFFMEKLGHAYVVGQTLWSFW
jgi:hypothetical protein